MSPLEAQRQAQEEQDRIQSMRFMNRTNIHTYRVDLGLGGTPGHTLSETPNLINHLHPKTGKSNTPTVEDPIISSIVTK